MVGGDAEPGIIGERGEKRQRGLDVLETLAGGVADLHGHDRTGDAGGDLASDAAGLGAAIGRELATGDEGSEVFLEPRGEAAQRVAVRRIEMGALVLDKEWCDVVELVHSTLTRAQRLLADFSVQTRIQSPLPLIHADYAQVERALYNLLENAARHSPRHTQIGVTVDILGQKALPTGMAGTVARGVRVQVMDEGPGIPEEERERVFRSFYSMDAHGNGLGLAICRGIIEAHQGRIWVEANERGGANFVFVLPIAS